ncbi:MAG: pilus assembly PilX N-terminal domain-containing protein [Gemmatimonadota bacterium]|nr:pilus assembly PilX N-terminal domain-containing protein [Gemmatimonadota bacterium]
MRKDELFLACRHAVRRTSGERGAALLIVLITLVGLTALAAAGIGITTSELRVSENDEFATRALLAADAGLDAYLGSGATGAAGANYTVNGAAVTVTPVRLAILPDDRVIYRVVSTASVPLPDGGTAARAVSRLAMFAVGSIAVPASFTSATGLLKKGTAGTISGEDASETGNPKCPNSPKPSVAGVKVPPNGYEQDGGNPIPEGDPPIDDSETTEEILQDIGIDWAGIVNGEAVTPTFNIPPDTWPDFGAMPADEWPVIYVDGNQEVSSSESGRGTLIVRENLTMNGSFAWDGMVLVGGYITSNGYQVVEGATVAGLNVLLGESIASTDIGNGNKEFKYHSCNLLQASTAAFGGLAEIPGTWSEAL